MLLVVINLTALSGIFINVLFNVLSIIFVNQVVNKSIMVVKKVKKSHKNNVFHLVYGENQTDEKREQLQDSTHLLSDMDSARARVSEIESQLSSLQEKQQKGSQTLKFRVENLFCLGSPLGVFLTLRGIPLHGCDNNGLPNIISSNLCHRLFNIYHPTDPIAYRIEPLIYKHYASILPVDIQRFDAPLKRPYSECSVRGSSTSDTLADSSSEHSIASIPESSTETEVESSSLPKTIGYSLGNMFLTLIKKSPSDLLTRELKKMETEARKLEEMNPTPMPSCSVHNAPILEYRMDFQLKESSFENSYISALTSHTAYWSNQDVAFFILTHVFPNIQTC